MPDRKLDLVLFRTFAGNHTACFAGRVLFQSQLVGAERSGHLRGRLRDAWRLLISRHVPSARVAIQLGDESWHTTTDRHGYFFICEQHHASLDHEHTWLSFSCTARHDDCARPIEVRGELLTAPRSAQHIVISDIDDTVVHTGVANKLKMPWKLYFTN